MTSRSLTNCFPSSDSRMSLYFSKASPELVWSLALSMSVSIVCLATLAARIAKKLLPFSLKTFSSVWPSMELEGLLLLRPPARLLGTTGSAEQSSAEASDSAPPVEADEDEASPESEVPF